ncbi:MAG TPA: hypothetical protein VM537_29260 [Anaerolineae bacterium]|nr:hypothetical protein [Phycisphaerae bacterium]HUW13848.1 hypothetical protein [Anaerolineae bacterium]
MSSTYFIAKPCPEPRLEDDPIPAPEIPVDEASYELLRDHIQEAFSDDPPRDGTSDKAALMKALRMLYWLAHILDIALNEKEAAEYKTGDWSRIIDSEA